MCHLFCPCYPPFSHLPLSPFTHNVFLSFFQKPLVLFILSLFSPSPPQFYLFFSSLLLLFPLLILPLHCCSPFRQHTTVSWRLWRCWGSWRSALWPEAWWIGSGSKLPSSSSSPSPPGRPCMCGRLPSLVLSGNTSSKNSPSETKIGAIKVLILYVCRCWENVEITWVWHLQSPLILNVSLITSANLHFNAEDLE